MPQFPHLSKGDINRTYYIGSVGKLNCLTKTKSCDTVIFHKHSLVFIHSSQLPKALEKSHRSIFSFDIWSLIFSSWSDFRATEGKRMSCISQQTPFYHIWVCVNELVFGKHLRMGTSCQENQPWRGDWRFQSLPWFLGRREALEVDSVTSSQWCNQSCLSNEAPRKTQKEEPWRASRMEEENTFLCARPQTPRGQSSFIQELTLCIFPFDCWFLLFNILCNKLMINWVNGFPEFWEPFQQVNWTQQGDCWEPLIYSSPLVRSTADNLDLWLASNVGQSLGNWAFNCGIWCSIQESPSHVQLFVTPWTAAHQASLSFNIFWRYIQAYSVWTELNCKTLSWYWSTVWRHGKNSSQTCGNWVL